MTEKQAFTVRDAGTRVAAVQAIMRLPLSAAHEVRIAPASKSRSVRQNNLYWEWMEVIGRETGHHKDEIHDYCRQRFLPKRFVEIRGEVREVRPSTTRLKVAEMSEYMTSVEAFAAELGIGLPHPEEAHLRGAA